MPETARSRQDRAEGTCGGAANRCYVQSARVAGTKKAPGGFISLFKFQEVTVLAVLNEAGLTVNAAEFQDCFRVPEHYSNQLIMLLQ